ncbi:putative RNA-directed DNA polymerase from transposon BS [Portunus trituberculatus]|uniref:Putative RNA-directed DNA polymerase from transposon BS n=1 Tax=Portunus trituberculatus TaxID=210409 RepID=A0A5B7CWZ9_PORTR|nr:putative RNA-directed DNA polymerase from transposon BS [Portunus trituberculatus]
MPSIKVLRNNVFRALAGLNPWKAYGPDGAKLFQLCLLTFTFPSCWKFAYIQPVPKKGDHSNPSNYHPIALISCMSKIFQSILNRKIFKHLSLHNLLSDCQYGFRQGHSIGDLLAFLTESWSSSFRDFGETFAAALDIQKAFDRVWHKALISKLPSYFSILLSATLSQVSFPTILLQQW